MEAITGPIAIAFGAISAAIITAVFSYFNLASSKESKVSEFRQEWVNSLRDDISKYTSSVQSLKILEEYLIAHAEPLITNSETIYKRAELHNGAIRSYNSILLRINKSEKELTAQTLNNNFLTSLTETHANFLAGETNDLGYLLEQVIINASPLLKYEWNRVRDGEDSYVNSKVYSLTIVYSAVTILVVGTSIIMSLPTH